MLTLGIITEMEGITGPMDQAGNDKMQPKGLDVAVVIDAT